MNNIFSSPINNIGGNKSTTGGSKSEIPEDIYEAVCIGLADAGESTTEYQGKQKTKRNIVLVWALDHVNGFDSTSVITDWRSPHNHENSAWTKEIIIPTKLKINALSDLVGKCVRVEIVKAENGYPQIARYFASKKPIEVPEGLYLPAWIYKKAYPFMKHNLVLDGARPVQEKETNQASVATPMPGWNAPMTENQASVNQELESDLPW